MTQLRHLPSRMLSAQIRIGLSLAIAVCAIGCSAQPVEGPDKLASHEVLGALNGAGAGAITGVQVGAGAGPGVAIGAGFGAVVGAIQGMMKDADEDQQARTAAQIKAAQGRVKAQGYSQSTTSNEWRCIPVGTSIRRISSSTVIQLRCVRLA